MKMNGFQCSNKNLIKKKECFLHKTVKDNYRKGGNTYTVSVLKSEPYKSLDFNSFGYQNQTSKRVSCRPVCRINTI